jgi:5'-deoxynucleotidase YfbR-like HD superfamily hydrolase
LEPITTPTSGLIEFGKAANLSEGCFRAKSRLTWAAMSPEDRIIDTVIALDTLADLPRTGWLLRGVSPCESIADHSFGVALVALLLTDALREAGEQVDGERVLRMAILHDAPEARTGDIPMPSKTAELESAIDLLEARLAGELRPGSPADWSEAERGESGSPRGRLLTSCDDDQGQRANASMAG